MRTLTSVCKKSRTHETALAECRKEDASFALQKFLDVCSRNCFGSTIGAIQIYLFLDYALAVICIDRAYVEAYKAPKALSSTNSVQYVWLAP